MFFSALFSCQKIIRSFPPYPPPITTQHFSLPKKSHAKAPTLACDKKTSLAEDETLDPETQHRIAIKFLNPSSL